MISQQVKVESQGDQPR